MAARVCHGLQCRRPVELLQYLRDDGLRPRDPGWLERWCERERLQQCGGEVLEGPRRWRNHGREELVVCRDIPEPVVPRIVVAVDEGHLSGPA